LAAVKTGCFIQTVWTAPTRCGILILGLSRHDILEKVHRVERTATPSCLPLVDD
jgi:hypothetical protein